MTAFSNLQGHQYMSLTTFRKTGVPVATPVWFASEGDVLYMMTQNHAGKMKRIQHTPRVTVAPCKVNGEVLGDTASGTARLLSGDEAKHANDVLNRKYGLMKRFLGLLAVIRGDIKKWVFLEIKPA